MNDWSKVILNKVIGMTKDEAIRFSSGYYHSIRVVEEDGKHFIVTMELNPTRVNVRIKAGIIYEATIG